MKQQEIKSLLEEAANLKCSWQRRNQIQCELGAASAAMKADGVYEINTPAAGMHTVAEGLFCNTVLRRPDLLPSLFPVFAFICGDRERNMICADIKWSFTQ